MGHFAFDDALSDRRVRVWAWTKSQNIVWVSGAHVAPGARLQVVCQYARAQVRHRGAHERYVVPRGQRVEERLVLAVQVVQVRPRRAASGRAMSAEGGRVILARRGRIIWRGARGPSSEQASCPGSVHGTHSMVGTAGSIGPYCCRYADLPMWIVPSRVSKEPWRAMRVG